MADNLTGAIEQIGADIRALRYDSGLRDLRSIVRADLGWDTSREVLAVTVERQGSAVEVSISNLARTDGTGEGWVQVLRLDLGFRPSANVYIRDFLAQRARITTAGFLEIQNPSPALNYFTFNFLTRQSPPATPPGDPA